MAFKSAVGKKTTISIPAAGAIKVSSPATSAIGTSLSKKSSNNIQAVEKTEAAPPAEIIAVVDFNRIHSTAGNSKTSTTPYGAYYDALDSIHSIMTEDVTYTVTKSLSNDPSGVWKSLKSTTDSDLTDAIDFIEDLTRLLDSIEQAEKSLDFGRVGDQDIQQAATDYLKSKIKLYDKKAEERSFDLVNIIGESANTNTNADSLREVLERLRKTLTKETSPFCKTVIDGLSQKNANDLNVRTGNDHAKAFKLFDSMSTGTGNLFFCSEILSHVMLMSSGIARVKNDQISARISFNSSDLASIFNGAMPGNPLPFRRSLSSGNLGSNLVTLSLIQYDGAEGNTVIPVQTEDSPKQSGYKSGPNALIRSPLRNGNFTFDNFDAFTAQFEKNRLELESYLELLLGYLDTENELTPSGILRTIIKNFVAGLNVVSSNVSAAYELLAVSFASQETPGSENIISDLGEDYGIENLRQEILRSAATLKLTRITSSVTSNQGDDSQYPTTLSTSKVSEGSETLLSDAIPTTTQIENKSPTIAVRDIERLASASPGQVETMLYNQILLRAKDGPSSKAEIQKEIDDSKKKNIDYEKKLEEAKKALIIALGVTALTAGTIPGSSAEAVTAYAKYKNYESKINANNKYIDELKSALANATKYTDKETIINYFLKARTTTSGTFFSSIVDAYDEIIESAKKRVPEGLKLTDSHGLTSFGTLDEYGIMSLIVECYAKLASQIRFSLIKDSIGNLCLPAISSAYSLLKIDLDSILSSEPGTDIGKMELLDAQGIATSLSYCAVREQAYQDSHAYLSAFSDVMFRAKENLKSSAKDILSTPSRQTALDTPAGRNMMESLTSQQLIYRRALIDRYFPVEAMGYLPARVVYSVDESTALDFLLSSPPFSERTSENSRITFAGIPTGVLNSNRRYVNQDLGDIKYSGMIEMAVHRHDHEFEDLIFKEKIFLFDPQLYVTPDSFTGYKNVKSSGTSDPALSLAKRMRFTLYDKNGSQVLDYNGLKNNERYKNLSGFQVDAILKNTLLSYLLETYCFKLAGILIDESVSLQIDDTISDAGLAAITAASALNLPDLKLPTAQQLQSMVGSDGEISYLTQVPGITSGDKELIAALASSFLIKSEKPIDRLLAASTFDRTFAVIVDTDDFEIDEKQSISENGALAKVMIDSLRKRSWVYQNGSSLFLRSRDPLVGGFSIGNISVQFVPHTIGEESGTLLRVAKDKFNTKTNEKTLKFTSPKKSPSSGLSPVTSSSLTSKTTKSLTSKKLTR